MPLDSAALGTSLTETGRSQVAAGERLRGTGGRIRALAGLLRSDKQILRSLEEIETGVRAVRSVLGLVVTGMNAAGSALNGIRVPTLQVRSASLAIPVVGDVRVVTGIDVEDARPFGPAASALDGVARQFDDVRTGLLAVAHAMRDVRQELPAIRAELTGAADECTAAGDTLAESGRLLQDAGASLGP
jgi:hypothetical protein